jgi:hypothetical protein
MAEKNEDIKQLFTHLGLNPNDYQELRSAPRTPNTHAEAPRRWSLLDSVTTNKVRATPNIAPTLEQFDAPVPPPPGPTIDPPQTAVAAAPALDEPETAPTTRSPEVASTRTSIPAIAPPAPEKSSLQSFFESVKEPVSQPRYPPPAPLTPAPPLTALDADSATARLLSELRRMPEQTATQLADLASSRWAHVAAAPVIDVLPPKPATPAQVASGSLAATFQRLRSPQPDVKPKSGTGKLALSFKADISRQAAAERAERLDDVFRRLQAGAQSQH